MSVMTEKHFTVQELSKMWGFSSSMIRRLFEEENGVFRVIRPETRHKRGYKTITIPESVAARVYARW